MSETPTGQTQGAPTLSGKMFLFERPELINKEQHGDLGITRPEKRYEFCAHARAVPITVSEIPAAMKDYPIIFSSAEQPVPLAVTGLIDDINLFVDDNGEWEMYHYIPGYVRRYPFGVASETGGDRIAIVIDRAFSGWTSGGETPLFENGEPSENTRQAIEYCQSYEEDRQRTAQFAQALKDLNLISGQSAQYTPIGESEPRTFAEYLGVDENAVKNLPAEKVVELRDNGILPLVYAMIMSFGNWRLILERRGRRFGLTDKDIMNPVAKN